MRSRGDWRCGIIRWILGDVILFVFWFFFFPKTPCDLVSALGGGEGRRWSALWSGLRGNVTGMGRG